MPGIPTPGDPPGSVTPGDATGSAAPGGGPPGSVTPGDAANSVAPGGGTPGSATPGDPPGSTPPGGDTPGGPRPRRSARRAIAVWGSLTLVVLLVAALVGGYLKYRSVWDSIHRITVTGLGKRPPRYTSALNLLVFGSGSLAGLTRRQELAWHVGSEQGDAVAETLMIVHISPGRHQVTVVNIPRDTVVPVYGCAHGSGGGTNWAGQQASPGSVEQIGATLSYGGPSCLWKTIEHQTGIRIDHFIELSYLGLIKIVNDAGGVNVCLPFTVDNVNSGLRLTAGAHHINGVTFLEFWRTRENIGTGSDLQRIQRDDYLLAQVLQGIVHSGLLSNPVKLVQMVSGTASTITTDSALTQSGMLQTAESLRGVSGKTVQLVTAPNVPYPGNLNWVEFSQPSAHRLFHAIAHDTKLPSSARHHRTARLAHPATAATIPASQITVKVLNGAGVAGIAGTAATALTSRGFHVAGPADAAHFGHIRSVIEYASAAELPAVATLRQQIPAANVRKNLHLAAGTLELIIGSDFTGLAPRSAHPPRPQQSPGSLAAAYGGISGGASCKSDAGAFAGPLSPGG
jgi:LCP family protein required for cell wall assembly